MGCSHVIEFMFIVGTWN